MKLRPFPAFSIGLFVLFLFCVVLFFFRPARVCFGTSCLTVEVADSQAERSAGLMFRKSLADSRGMLFVFPHSDRWGFWMKNTLIPLDIIWLDEGGRIVDMAKGVQPHAGDNPPTLAPVFAARYVVEANAGFAEKHGVKVGDRARIDWNFPSKEIQ